MPTPTVLPRPGTGTGTTHTPRPPIPGPSEPDFVATFGTLLPRAQWLDTEMGRAAYYYFPASASPSPSTSTTDANPPSRVLLLHGVQTPALGLLPLTQLLRRKFPAAAFVLLDLWGHGLSDTPVLAHEGGLFAGLVERVVRRLGWDDGDREMAVVGYSFGSVVGMRYLASLSGSSSSTAAGEQRGEGKGMRHIHSFTLVAPAGLVRRAWFETKQQEWLGTACRAEEEGGAAEWVVRTLEGGELQVPGDWRERVSRGEVVAEKLREWQMLHHPGHAASVVGIFRDGGVLDNDALFVEVSKLGLRGLVVLGEDDDLSTEEEVRGFGFDVRVVKKTGHAVIRERAGEVAELIRGFWGVRME